MDSPAIVVVGGIEVDETDMSSDAWDNDEMGGDADVCGDDKMDGDL